MLNKQFRLQIKNFNAERKVSSAFYSLKIGRNTKGVSRFGFIVPKKIDKRATVRNRIKRKIRNCIEEKLTQIPKGYDFLFIVKRNIVEDNFCDMIYSQFKKERFLK